MAIQQNLLVQAKQGQPDAIASLMNRTLNKQGSHVQVRRRSGDYKLLVEADKAPPQKATVQWIVKGLDRLSISAIETITIYGKSQQSNKPEWQQSIRFSLQERASALQKPSAPASAKASEKPLDLTEYCFTRNKSLLSGKLTLPSKPVIQLVLAFASLSNAHKSEALPHIDLALRKCAVPEADFSGEVQAWFEQLAALEGPDVRKGSIWLSRYCLDTEGTLDQLGGGAIADNSANDSNKESARSPLVTDSAATQQTASDRPKSNFPPYAGPGASSRPPKRMAYRPTKQAQPKKAKSIKKSIRRDNTPLVWIIPLAWSVCLALLMVLGISSASTASAVENNDSYTICSATLSDSQTCALAVQLVGDESFFTEIVRDSVPLPPEGKEIAIEQCSEYINYEAGLFTDFSTPMPVVLSSNSEEIFSGVLLTNVTQKSGFEPNETLRLACIHYTYADEFSDSAGGDTWLEELASDVIPMNWPSDPYAGNIMAAALSVEDSLGAYDDIIRLFSYPLFTAAGLFITVLICSAYSCSTALGLYKASAVLGVIECFIAILPVGWFLTLSLEILALGLTARVVPEFDVALQGGYGSLAFGTLSLLIVRGILLGILSFVLYAITTSLVIVPAIASTV